MKSNLKYVKGNLFDNIPTDRPVVIPHVCNDIGAWGAGFVVPLGNKYPKAKEDYLKWRNGRIGFFSPFELGEVQYVRNDNVVVANMIAQRGVGGPRPLDYRGLVKCMLDVYRVCTKENRRWDIICPKFGSGLAGGDWNIIETYIKTIWEELDVTVYYL